MLGALGTFQIAEHPENPAPETRAQQRAIEAVAEKQLSARGNGDALTATNNPPLYYAVQVIPYKLAGARVLDKLALMRCVSVLMAAITVLLVFMFLRELLPLPALGMRHQFAYLPLWDTWFKGLFGRFGWLDYGFPAWF